MLSVAPDRPVDPLALAILALARDLIGQFQVGVQEG
jgi:hypothetical protein